MKRKIIQICVSGTDDEPDIIYALCDDGSVWGLSMGMKSKGWQLIEDVPQGELPVINF